MNYTTQDMGDDHHPWEFPCFRSLEGNFQQDSDAFPRTHARIDGLVALRELTFMMETVSAKGVRELLGCWKILPTVNTCFSSKGKLFLFCKEFLGPLISRAFTYIT